MYGVKKEITKIKSPTASCRNMHSIITYSEIYMCTEKYPGSYDFGNGRKHS